MGNWTPDINFFFFFKFSSSNSSILWVSYEKLKNVGNVGNAYNIHASVKIELWIQLKIDFQLIDCTNLSVVIGL